MTGIELMVVMLLQTCVPSPPHVVPDSPQPKVETTWYECPLLGEGAEFVVWRHICGEGETHAVAIRDMRSGKGFTLNRFREIEPNFVEVYATPAYMPPCREQDAPNR